MQGDILPYLKDRTFDPDSTRTMDEAYEKARRMLRDRSQPPSSAELARFNNSAAVPNG